MKNNRVIFLIAVVLVLILVAGCAKVNITVDINNDGTGSIEGIIAVSEMVVEGQDAKTIIEENLGIDFDQYEDDVMVKDYAKDGYVGVQVSEEIKEINDIEKIGNGFSVSISDDAKKTLKISGDVLDTSVSEVDISSIMNTIDMEMLFTIKLPNVATSHNATTVEDDGKTLVWDLTEQSFIELEADLNQGGGGMIVYIIIGVVALIAILALVLIISNDNKTNEYIGKECKEKECNNECKNDVQEVAEQELETDEQRHIRQTVEKYKKM